MRYFLSVIVVGLVAAPAWAVAPTVDGTLDASYGAPIAVQAVQTGFGDAIPPGALNGSELDAGYATIAGGRLYMMFTGNLEPNFNKLDVLIDSQAGGENTLSSTPQYDFQGGGGTWNSTNMGGLIFDNGFTADYHLFARWGNSAGPFEVDFVNRNGGTAVAVPASNGRAAAAGLISTGTIPSGNVATYNVGGAPSTALTRNLKYALDDNNAAGVGGGSGAATMADAAAVTTGMEFSIALADLGNPAPGSTIKIAAMVNNGDHNYLSNQILGPLAPPQGNLGGDGAGGFTGTLSGIDFNLFDGTQYFEVPVPAVVVPTWGVDASGNWSNAANWTGGVPNAVGETAAFLGVITAPRTVTLDVSETVGNLTFNNANSYTLAGPGTLTIDGGDVSSISVLSGSHTIAAPLTIVAGNTVTKSGPGTLTISGAQSHGVGAVLNVTGGVVNFNSDPGAGGANLTINVDPASVNFNTTANVAALNIAAGSTAKLSQNGAPGLPPYIGSNKYLGTGSLTISGTGVLDVTNNTVVVMPGVTTLAPLTAALTSGAHIVGGVAQWDGPGINSSTAHAEYLGHIGSGNDGLTAVGILDTGDAAVNPGYDHVNNGDFNVGGAGDPLTPGSILIKYTYLGDTQLAGKVQFSDFLVWKAAFSANLAGGHVGGWAHAQFDYSETQTTFADFLIWKNSFTKALAGLLPPLHAAQVGNASAVPEPSASVLVAIGMAGVFAFALRREHAARLR